MCSMLYVNTSRYIFIYPSLYSIYYFLYYISRSLIFSFFFMRMFTFNISLLLCPNSNPVSWTFSFWYIVSFYGWLWLSLVIIITTLIRSYVLTYLLVSPEPHSSSSLVVKNVRYIYSISFSFTLSFFLPFSH